MASITLDVAHDENAISLFDACIDMIDGEAIVPAIVGEANGWPIVRFDGTRDALERMIVRYCGGDTSHAAEYAIDA